MEKVMVAMSGGVDSSVAAYLVKETGYETMGVTMRLFDNKMVNDMESKCCSLDDVLDASSVSEKIGIKHYVFNFADDFEKEVIRRFCDAYEMGRTPNPCIDCNRYIKFKRLFRRAAELEQDYVATGHYVRTEFDEASGRYIMRKAKDLTKDQSYVLYSLTQEQLAHTLFPLGNMTKIETREIAESQGFITAKKKESQDICFVPNGDYAEFIERYTGKKYPCGDFVDAEGNVLGKHQGIIKYTIGQRKGLCLALKQPMYVCKKDLEKNRVILGLNGDLFTKELTVSNLNFISCEKTEKDMRVSAKVRYSQKESPATIIPIAEDRVKVIFDEPQRAVTSGQAAVFYDGDIVLGGGTIE